MKNNKWYSENGANNHSLKLNISFHSPLIVTEGPAGPTSLNHLRTWPVHIPRHVISFSEKCLQRVSWYQTVSTCTLPLQGDSLVTETWPVSEEQGFNTWAKCIWSKTLPHPHPWGQGLHSSQPAGFWDEGGEKCRAHPRGCSEDRVSRDWTIQSPAGHGSLTVLLISNSEE